MLGVDAKALSTKLSMLIDNIANDLQDNDVNGSTMAEAISHDGTLNDEIPMENVEISENETSSNPKKKWPKFPNGKSFNNGFGFQRF